MASSATNAAARALALAASVRSAAASAASASASTSPLSAVASSLLASAAPAPAPRRSAIPLEVDLRTGTFRAAAQVPLRGDLPPLPRAFTKKTRQHAHWKLRPAHSYRSVAPHMARLALSFDPAEDGTSGCKELRRQALSPKARAAFKVAVECEERSDARGASVAVTWSDGSATRVDARNCTLLDILDQLAPVAQRLAWKEEDKDM
jgi:hypothetical protein